MPYGKPVSYTTRREVHAQAFEGALCRSVGRRFGDVCLRTGGACRSRHSEGQSSEGGYGAPVVARPEHAGKALGSGDESRSHLHDARRHVLGARLRFLLLLLRALRLLQRLVRLSQAWTIVKYRVRRRVHKDPPFVLLRCSPVRGLCDRFAPGFTTGGENQWRCLL